MIFLCRRRQSGRPPKRIKTAKFVIWAVTHHIRLGPSLAAPALGASVGLGKLPAWVLHAGRPAAAGAAATATAAAAAAAPAEPPDSEGGGDANYGLQR